MTKIFITSVFFSYITLSIGARILGVVPTPSYSHQVVFHPLWKELSLRGHQVTVLTTDPIKDPSLTNLTEIDLHFSYEIWNDKILEAIATNQESTLKMIDLMVKTIHNAIDKQLSHPSVQALIKNETEHFDLLIIESLYPTMTAFSERFKCPFIGMTSFSAPNGMYRALGNPTHPVLYPEVILPFNEELTFPERIASTLYEVVMKFYANIYVMPMEEATVKKHFGSNYPSLEVITRKISMLFVNTDPVFHRVMPLVPAIIQIGGGINLKPPTPLPKDLQKHLDKASQGFIYFSLGSNVKSKDLSKNTLSVFLETFAELPYLVLWKFELEELPNKPDNVIISKWFPQQDIMRHPNIKLFITQGGLQSIDEATYSYVPMLGLPFFADQSTNINKMVSKGLGLSLEHESVDKQAFRETILELIKNPKYRNRVRELADLARDQPMTGLEKAVWWTEYVLRHKGARHLRSPAIDIPFYQYYLLDVIGFCVLVVSVILFLLIKLVKLIFKLVNYFMGKPKVKQQ